VVRSRLNWNKSVEVTECGIAVSVSQIEENLYISVAGVSCFQKVSCVARSQAGSCLLVCISIFTKSQTVTAQPYLM
jgi:hypothetical protein